MKKPTLYLDTTIVSLLAAHPSSDMLTGQRQHYTRLWWDFHRHQYTLVKSASTEKECRRGDPDAANRRLEYLAAATVNIDEVTDEMTTLAAALIVPAGPLPKNAATDAPHLATAAITRCDFILTWNFTHMVNPQIRRIADTIIRSKGYEPASIITPDQDVEAARR